MQERISIPSASSTLNQQKSLNLKEKAIDLLNAGEVSKKEIIDLCNQLRMNPKIEIEVKEKLFLEKSFEIFIKDNVNPIFILNLLNIINILNFIWNVTKKNIALFHKILLELNLLFSYVKNNVKEKNYQLEYVLLSNLPLNFYELIAKYGKKCFNKNYKFDTDFLSADRNKQQIGLVYQENTISQLKSRLEDNGKETPKIMYYLDHIECISLFKQGVFNSPKNFIDLEYISCDKYKGYNEIDYSFILSENLEISQSLIFNKVFEETNFVNFLNLKQDENIIFPKDTNIFIETKTFINSVQDINDMKKVSNIFSSAFSNIAYDGIDKIFKKDKNEYYFFFNNQRSDVLNLAQKEQIDKEIKIFYNSGYVQISSIVSLQNQIRLINNKIEDIEERVKNEKKEMEEKMKNEIIKVKKDCELSIFKSLNDAKLSSIQNVLGKIKPNSNISCSLFKNANEKYFDLCQKLLEKEDNKITKIATNIIGKQLILEDEVKEFFNLLELLDKKISENTFASCYYSTFKDILIGPNWNNSYTYKSFKKLDIFSKSKNISNIILNILKFIVVLENDQNLENHFFKAVLYYVSEIETISSESFNYFYLYLDSKDVKKTTIKFIKSLNIQFLKSLVSK